MRFSHIEAFRAVMLSGSTTAAAKTLHTSQPNISRSIAQLEQSTGLRLFDRMPGRIVPTNDGLAFFKEVQRSFTGLLYLKDAANRIRRRDIVIFIVLALIEDWRPVVSAERWHVAPPAAPCRVSFLPRMEPFLRRVA